jgi:hypothetical protein
MDQSAPKTDTYYVAKLSKSENPCNTSSREYLCVMHVAHNFVTFTHRRPQKACGVVFLRREFQRQKQDKRGYI